MYTIDSLVQDQFYLNAILLYSKEEHQFYAKGVGCDNIATYELDATQIQVYRKKMLDIISGKKQLFGYFNYMILENFAGQFLYYVMHGDWFVFLVINTSSMVDIFRDMADMTPDLRKFMEGKTDIDQRFFHIKQRLSPTVPLCRCETCSDTVKCMPSIAVHSQDFNQLIIHN